MAKKIEDLKQYWQEMAQKAGLSPEDIQAFSNSLGNEAVAKVFRQGFVPVPEHHSTLDEVRADADARKATLDQWYEEQALPAYRTNIAGIERLRQYESKYGEPDAGGDPNPSGFRTKEDLDKYIDDKLRAQQSGFVGLAKVTPTLMLDYFQRFNEKLDLDEIEKISVKQGVPPEVAYERFIAPKVEERRQADFQAKIKEAEERGARQALSNHNLPTESLNRGPFFDRPQYTEKDTPTPIQEERMSQTEFVDGWNNYEAGLTRKGA